MKTTFQQGIIKKIIGIAAAGAFAFTPALGTISAEAAPPSHAPAYGRHDKKEKKYKKNKDRGRYDRNRNDRNRNDRNRNDRNRNDRNRKDRGRYERDRERDRDRNNDYRSYTGVVTKVRSSKEFDLRSGGNTYNVTLSRNSSRRLDRNDYVRVYGKRKGENNIDNANVSILRNR